MSDRPDLHLHEQILLLALHDEKGTIHLGASFDHAAGGAILAELLLTGRLGVEGEKSKARIVVRNRNPVGEPLLDDCLALVVNKDKQRKPSEWVQSFSGVKKLKHRVAARLVDLGILREEQDKVLFFFDRTRYPERDRSPERQLTECIRRAIVGGGPVEPEISVIIALARTTDLLKRAVDKETLRDHKDRIKKIAQGELAGKATKEAVEAMQAAVMVVVMIPVITSH